MAPLQLLARSTQCYEENDTNGRTETLKTLNLLNLNSNSACEVFDEMFLACGRVFWSWSLVRWPLNAPRGCLIYPIIFGEEKYWISPKMTNLVQTWSEQNLKNLNCGRVDLDGSRLGVLSTSQRSWFGIKTQMKSCTSFVNHLGPK